MTEVIPPTLTLYYLPDAKSPKGAEQVFFGYCLDVMLYGFLTAQVYLYYLAFPSDKKITKAVVYFVYAMGSIQTAFAMRDFAVLFATPLGDIFTAGNMYIFGFTWFTVPISSSLVAVTVQLFYARRIYMISKIKSVTSIVSILALAQLGLGIFTSFNMYYMENFPAQYQCTSLFCFPGISGMAWGFVGALCDLIIAIFMFVYISKQTRQTSRVMQQSVVKIKRLTLETGFLTAVASICYLLTAFFDLNSAFIIPGLTLSKLYGNSILAMLNNRMVFGNGRYTSHTVMISIHEPDITT